MCAERATRKHYPIERTIYYWCAHVFSRRLSLTVITYEYIWWSRMKIVFINSTVAQDIFNLFWVFLIVFLFCVLVDDVLHSREGCPCWLLRLPATVHDETKRCCCCCCSVFVHRFVYGFFTHLFQQWQAAFWQMIPREIQSNGFSNRFIVSLDDFKLWKKHKNLSFKSQRNIFKQTKIVILRI